MKRLSFWTAAAAAAAALVAVAPMPAQAQAQPSPTGPSFACTAARTAVERTICARPELAAADREMAALFALARTSAFGSGPSNQLVAQRKALREIRDCGAPAGKQRLERCIGDAYARRNGELAVAALLAAPDTALATARRVDPAFAPVLEATALWAVEPVNADWSARARVAKRTRIAGLLRPFLDDLLTKEEQSFGRSILTEPGTDGVAVRSVDDLFRSDRHFAAFLNVVGPYLPEPGAQAPGGETRMVPCAAIVRHPDLLRATTSLFGSTMDNFVLRNDCEQSLPPAPALTALDQTLLRTWPACDGTIRFAAYRGYQTRIEEARLGRTPRDPRAQVPKLAGVAAADVEAARAEMARYYQAYLGKSAAQAATMARDALAAVLANAHECGG